MKVRSKFLRFSVSMALFVGLGTAYYLGWEKIEPRLVNIFSDNMSSRTQIYETTLKMIDDYGLFGSGPGSFEAVAQFELGKTFTRWQSWVHNDYLEFYLTFGKVGGSLMCCTLFFLAVNATLILFFNPQKTVTWFGLVSLLGVGIHAAGDFPLQTLSILIPVCILSTLLTVSQKYEGNTASPLV
jgi:O-antigen ligase